MLAGMGLVWALPYALIKAELASAIPEEGGADRWYRAFLSSFWSFQSSCLDWITWILDAAIYPPLRAAYLLGFFAPEADRFASWTVCLVVIWGCTVLNIRGVAVVGQLTVVLSALVLAPVAIMLVLGLPHVSLSNLQPFVPEGSSIPSALKLAFIFSVWSYSGYGGLAYASEEIVDAESPYPRLLAIILPLTIAVYVLPPFFEQLHRRYGTPARFLIIQAIFHSAVTYSFSFVEILIISTWIAVPSYILLFVTPIVLRIRQPDLRGPFRIPGGLPVLILCAVPPAAIAIFVLFTVSSDEVLAGLGFFALPPLLYVWSKWSSRGSKSGS